MTSSGTRPRQDHRRAPQLPLARGAARAHARPAELLPEALLLGRGIRSARSNARPAPSCSPSRARSPSSSASPRGASHPTDGWTHVASVTAANDFGLYDLRAADKGSNVRSKGGDGFTPLGPTLIDAASVDPAGLRVRTWVNGELVQEDTSDTLLFPFGRLVADLSQLMTLETGDVILTGTPAGSSVVVPGDVVEVEVDAPDAAGAPSSGRLVTTVTEGTCPSATSARRPRSTTASASRRGATPRAAGLRGARRPPSSSPTSCATCSAPSASRPSACSCASAATRHLHRGRARQPRRRPRRRPGPHAAVHPVPPRPVRRARAAATTRRRSRSTPSSPGEVLVIEARGERGTGTVGDVLALRAQVRGAAGIVTDGGTRDFDVVAALDIPTFSQGPHPLGARPPARAVGGRRRDRVRRRGGASPATSSWATATA